MEFPAGLIRVERVLTALLLAGVAAVAALETRSPLARAVREGKPWVGRVELSPPPAEGDSFALVYAPSRAYLISLAPADWQDPSLSAAGEPREFRFALPAGAPKEPALALASAVRPETLHAWLAALRPFSFERALLLLDLARLGPHQVRPAYLPEDESDRAAYLQTALGAAPEPPQKQPITVEVLNASGQKGIAYDVTKFLRSKGADVVHYGNVAGPAVSDTIVYDRTGRFENAEWVRDRLGCPAAAVSQVSAKSLVDVTVVLADDCKP